MICRKIILMSFFLSLFFSFSHPGPCEEKNTVPSNDSQAEQKGPEPLELTIHKVVEYLLRNNLDVKQALLEYRGASSPLLSYRSKYDYMLKGGADWSQKDNPDPSSTFFNGETTSSAGYNLGISKSFSTGTSLSASVLHSYQNVEGAGTFMGNDMGGIGYQTGFRVEIAQEILKNAFGINDRLTETQLKNREKASRRAVRLKLAGLLVNAVIAYWNTAVAEENLKTNRINLKSTEEIRDLIYRKMKLGLSEREDILDWNGKVLESKNTTEKAEKALFDARLAIANTLNLKNERDFILGKTFKTEAPVIELDRAMLDAFSHRVDWKNQQTALRNAEIEYRIASGEELPSLRIKAGAGTADYDPDGVNKTFDDYNRDYTVGFEFSYPLDNTAAGVRLRDARLDIQKQRLVLEKMRKDIRDEITSLVKQCDLDYRIYIQTKKSKEYAQGYYYQVLNKFRRGRYSAVELKLALDAYIVSRQRELQSLVDYNIALLRRDLARNVIFENLGIDIDGILKRIEN